MFTGNVENVRLYRGVHRAESKPPNKVCVFKRTASISLRYPQPSAVELHSVNVFLRNPQGPIL